MAEVVGAEPVVEPVMGLPKGVFRPGEHLVGSPEQETQLCLVGGRAYELGASPVSKDIVVI